VLAKGEPRQEDHEFVFEIIEEMLSNSNKKHLLFYYFRLIVIDHYGYGGFQEIESNFNFWRT